MQELGYLRRVFTELRDRLSQLVFLRDGTRYRVTRAVQCGVALGQALIKGSDILRLQRGHGLRADLLKLGQVSRGVPGKKHGFPQGVELGVHGCGLAHDFRRGADVGPGLVEQIGLNLGAGLVDLRQAVPGIAQGFERVFIRRQQFHRTLCLLFHV